MKVYQTNEIKNIALLGSSGSGKTTLVEAMLFESGVVNVADLLPQKTQLAIIFLLNKSMVTPFSLPFST